MSTTVRIVCEVELTVDTWNSTSTFEELAATAVREGEEKLRHISRKADQDLRLIAVKEVRFVTHSIQWDKVKK